MRIVFVVQFKTVKDRFTAHQTFKRLGKFRTAFNGQKAIQIAAFPMAEVAIKLFRGIQKNGLNLCVCIN